MNPTKKQAIAKKPNNATICETIRFIEFCANGLELTEPYLTWQSQNSKFEHLYKFLFVRDWPLYWSAFYCYHLRHFCAIHPGLSTLIIAVTRSSVSLNFYRYNDEIDLMEREYPDLHPFLLVYLTNATIAVILHQIEFIASVISHSVRRRCSESATNSVTSEEHKLTQSRGYERPGFAIREE